MDSRGVRSKRHNEEEESYFISMADMMVGLLFIFIILLLYFAMEFRHTTDALSGANGTRSKMLVQLKKELAAHGITKVEIDTENGVLSLHDDILFDTAQYELTPVGKERVKTVANVLMQVLPCYADFEDASQKPENCEPEIHKIDAVFIEGHTDSVPLGQHGVIADNLDLSALRATHTFRTLVADEPKLDTLVNLSGERAVPIFSVSGYGDQRPTLDATGTPDEINKRNRRIDLRFLMITPRSETGEAINRQIEAVHD